jgi:hypothetical protein
MTIAAACSPSTLTDPVISMDEWAGCGGMQLAGQTSDGTAYCSEDMGASRVAVYRYEAGHGACARGSVSLRRGP